MSELKPCPCGKIPEALHVEEGPTTTHAYVRARCCYEWGVEFRTINHTPLSKESYEAGIKAWNDAPRGEQNLAEIKAEAIEEAISLLSHKAKELRGDTKWAMIQETAYQTAQP